MNDASEAEEALREALALRPSISGDMEVMVGRVALEHLPALLAEVARLREAAEEPCCATDHARVCAKPGCIAANVRRDDGHVYCAAGHPTRWCEVSERDAALAEVARLREALEASHARYHTDVDGAIAGRLEAESAVERLQDELHGLREDGITAATQNRIRDMVEAHCRERLPDASIQIDGSGCDSGDPVDLTLAEVGQGLTALDDALDNCEQERDRLREALKSIAYHDVDEDTVGRGMPIGHLSAYEVMDRFDIKTISEWLVWCCQHACDALEPTS